MSTPFSNSLRHTGAASAVTVPSTAALPDVLAAVARARLATARDASEAGTRMGTGLAELRRAHGG